MPGKTILEIPLAEQEQMLAQLRAARYGHVLALHMLLLCAAGWTPTQIAAALFCSRSRPFCENFFDVIPFQNRTSTSYL